MEGIKKGRKEKGRRRDLKEHSDLWRNGDAREAGKTGRSKGWKR